MIAVGLLADRLPAATDASMRAGAGLAAATIAAAGRLCDVTRLRTTLPLSEGVHEAGVTLVVRGVWRRSGDPLLPRAPTKYGFVSGSRAEPVDSAGRRAALGLPARIRASLAGRLERRLPSREMAAIAKALLLADRTTLSRETRQRFVDAGIVHLLAISGLHVGMIAGGIVWVLGLVERRPRRWVWAALAVTAYVAMIGAPPAATRAGLLFWGHAYCRWRGRPARVSDLAGAAALVALGRDPLLLTDPGFQLSFGGYAGVLAGHRCGVALAARLAVARGGADSPLARLGRRTGWLLDGLASSAGAFILTAPIAAIHFGRVVATSIPASLASTGLVALALPTVAATALLPGLAGTLAGGAAGSLLLVLESVAGAFAGVPLRWRVGETAGWSWVLAGLLTAGLLRSRRSRRIGWGLAVLALVFASLAAPAARRYAGTGTPLVCHLDVGQGDAAVARTSAGRWAVFDAGPGTSVLEGRGAGAAELRSGLGPGDAGRDVIAPFLRRHGVREIELLTLSHAHLDHFGGSGALFDGFRIRHVLDPGIPEPSASYLSFLERVDEERAVWIRATAGDTLVIDDLELAVLWPTPDAGMDVNESSLSFRVRLGPLSYLNTGDASVETEAEILHRFGPGAVRADVLKLGHHGSRTSSSVEWLRAARPAVAVMSLGRDNRYGHPHEATLRRLDSARVRRVWRTDRHGALCVEGTGDGWRIVDP